MLSNPESPHRRTEKDLDQALEKALRDDDASFLRWFVSKTKFKDAEPEYAWSRSDHPWCEVELNVENPETGDPEMLKRQGETDVLVVFRTAGGRRVALHVENKLASGRFTKHQPELYAVRAEKWLGEEKYGCYTDWDTVLLAPLSFLKKHSKEAQKFGAAISHEEVAQYVPAFNPHSPFPNFGDGITEDGEDDETPEQAAVADAYGMQAAMNISGCSVEEACRQLGLNPEDAPRYIEILNGPLIERKTSGHLTSLNARMPRNSRDD